MRSERLKGSRAHGRELEFYPQSSEKDSKGFEAAFWRGDSRLEKKLEQKDQLGQLQ